MSKIRFSRKFLAIPYGIFLALFVIIPLLLIIFYAATTEDPTTGEISLSFANFKTFFTNEYNFHTFLISLAIGLGNTIICLLIGYPIAYIIAKKEFKFGGIVVLLFVMPIASFEPCPYQTL